MLWRYNRTARREIDVLNANVRSRITAPTARRCFAPVHALAAQRKIWESIHIYFTTAPIFRVVAAPAPPRLFTRKRTHAGSP